MECTTLWTFSSQFHGKLNFILICSLCMLIKSWRIIKQDKEFIHSLFAYCVSSRLYVKILSWKPNLKWIEYVITLNVIYLTTYTCLKKKNLWKINGNHTKFIINFSNVLCVLRLSLSHKILIRDWLHQIVAWKIFKHIFSYFLLSLIYYHSSEHN